MFCATFDGFSLLMGNGNGQLFYTAPRRVLLCGAFFRARALREIPPPTAAKLLDSWIVVSPVSFNIKKKTDVIVITDL